MKRLMRWIGNGYDRRPMLVFVIGIVCWMLLAHGIWAVVLAARWVGRELAPPPAAAAREGGRP